MTQELVDAIDAAIETMAYSEVLDTVARHLLEHMQEHPFEPEEGDDIEEGKHLSEALEELCETIVARVGHIQSDGG